MGLDCAGHRVNDTLAPAPLVFSIVRKITQSDRTQIVFCALLMPNSDEIRV